MKSDKPQDPLESDKTSLEESEEQQREIQRTRELLARAMRFRSGELTYQEYKKLNVDQRRKYRELNKGREGHIKGRPARQDEIEARNRALKKRRKKDKMARESRRYNYQHS